MLMAPCAMTGVESEHGGTAQGGGGADLAECDKRCERDTCRAELHVQDLIVDRHGVALEHAILPCGRETIKSKVAHHEHAAKN